MNWERKEGKEKGRVGRNFLWKGKGRQNEGKGTEGQEGRGRGEGKGKRKGRDPPKFREKLTPLP